MLDIWREGREIVWEPRAASEWVWFHPSSSEIGATDNHPIYIRSCGERTFQTVRLRLWRFHAAAFELELSGISSSFFRPEDDV